MPLIMSTALTSLNLCFRASWIFNTPMRPLAYCYLLRPAGSIFLRVFKICGVTSKSRSDAKRGVAFVVFLNQRVPMTARSRSWARLTFLSGIWSTSVE